MEFLQGESIFYTHLCKQMAHLSLTKAFLQAAATATMHAKQSGRPPNSLCPTLSASAELQNGLCQLITCGQNLMPKGIIGRVNWPELAPSNPDVPAPSSQTFVSKWADNLALSGRHSGSEQPDIPLQVIRHSGSDLVKFQLEVSRSGFSWLYSAEWLDLSIQHYSAISAPNCQTFRLSK